jgi:Toc86/159 family protein import component
MDLVDLPDSDAEDEDEYDQLPPFKPLRKSQVQKLSKEQKKAYFEEYDYRVKLLLKKQWRDNLKRLKEIKKRGKDCSNDIGEDVDQEDEGPAPVPVPLPDFVLPQSFDSDNPSYRYRALEPASQFLVRPVLDAQGWDHDCGYDGVNIESNLAIAGQFPGAFTVQITKDKKDFNIQLDSSICAKHGENGSTMVGFDIQTIGRQLAYILRSETKLKKFKMNKSSAGISVTLLGENVVTGFKIEDQIAVGKRLALVGNAGTVRSGNDTAYGANFEVRLKSKDFPIEQDQSTLGLSLMKWRGDLGLMAHLQSQFSIGGNSKMAVHVGMNNKRSGQISIKTSSSELQAALIGIVPIAVSILQSIYPGSNAGCTNILDH